MRANGQAAPALDKTHQEEKSLNHDSFNGDSLHWGVFWNGMQAHSKLRRNRQIREQAARLPALWVAAVLEQMTRGMEDPITLAVDGFNPETSPQTVPYICLELANRGPAFTARVLAALSWPTLNWPADPDAARCIAELKRIGVRSFREASSVYTLATLNLLGLTQLADQACAQAGPGASQPEAPEALTDAVDEVAALSENDRLWQRVLEQLRMELPQATFDTWLLSTRLVAREGSQFIVSAPTQYGADWLAHRMQGAIKRTLSSVARVKDGTLSFRVGAETAA